MSSAWKIVRMTMTCMSGSCVRTLAVILVSFFFFQLYSDRHICRSMKSFTHFLSGIRNYEKESVRADMLNTSRISPYLHFGQVSPLLLLLNFF